MTAKPCAAASVMKRAAYRAMVLAFLSIMWLLFGLIGFWEGVLESLPEYRTGWQAFKKGERL